MNGCTGCSNRGTLAYTCDYLNHVDFYEGGRRDGDDDYYRRLDGDNDENPYYDDYVCTCNTNADVFGGGVWSGNDCGLCNGAQPTPDPTEDCDGITLDLCEGNEVLQRACPSTCGMCYSTAGTTTATATAPATTLKCSGSGTLYAEDKCWGDELNKAFPGLKLDSGDNCFRSSDGRYFLSGSTSTNVQAIGNVINGDTGTPIKGEMYWVST